MCGGVGSVRRAQWVNGCNNLNQIILSKFNVTITNNNEKHIYVFLIQSIIVLIIFPLAILQKILQKLKKNFIMNILN